MKSPLNPFAKSPLFFFPIFANSESLISGFSYIGCVVPLGSRIPANFLWTFSSSIPGASKNAKGYRLTNVSLESKHRPPHALLASGKTSLRKFFENRVAFSYASSKPLLPP